MMCGYGMRRPLFPSWKPISEIQIFSKVFSSISVLISHIQLTQVYFLGRCICLWSLTSDHSIPRLYFSVFSVLPYTACLWARIMLCGKLLLDEGFLFGCSWQDLSWMCFWRYEIHCLHNIRVILPHLSWRPSWTVVRKSGLVGMHNEVTVQF